MEFPQTETIRRASRAALALAASSLLSLHAGVLTFGTNWIVNGDAESGAGSTDGSAVPVPGWSPLNGLPLITAVQYASAPGNFPAVSDPGPPSRGVNFFAGGNTGTAYGSQILDISAFAAQVDAGEIAYSLSGYLGGWTDQDDYASLGLAFLDSTTAIISGNSIIGPKAIGRNGQTELLYESTTGVIPTGTRSLQFILQSYRQQGTYDDGYADNLSFVANDVSVAPAVPEPSTAALAACALLLPALARRYRRKPV